MRLGFGRWSLSSMCHSIFLYAIGQSGNLAFLDFVTGEAGKDTQVARAKDLLEQAGNRRTLRLEP